MKTDKGMVPAGSGAAGEQATQGLDGYGARAAGYYAQGARFCKWRNTYKIQDNTVSEYLIHHNAETLAKYAQLSQMNGIVPIVEPEVMIDGEHDIETCQRVSERVWAEVVRALHAHGVIFEGMLLKPNMVVYGADNKTVGEPVEVARATITTLSRTLPAAVPGVFFLSGGLSEGNASAYLNAMNANTDLPKPWALRFSYARALQSSALKVWEGKDENKAAARRAFLHRAKMNSDATLVCTNRKRLKLSQHSHTHTLTLTHTGQVRRCRGPERAGVAVHQGQRLLSMPCNRRGLSLGETTEVPLHVV